MATTIRVSEEFHAWIAAHSPPGETMEETVRRLILARGLALAPARFDEEDATRAAAAVSALRARDGDRLRAAREAV